MARSRTGASVGPLRSRNVASWSTAVRSACPQAADIGAGPTLPVLSAMLPLSRSGWNARTATALATAAETPKITSVERRLDASIMDRSPSSASLLVDNEDAAEDQCKGEPAQSHRR